MSENQKNLTVALDRALFEGQIQGVAVTFYQNERPPCGLAGTLDWYLQGAISRCIQKGAILGKAGECAYLPVSRNGALFHVILVGAGHASAPGLREPLSTETLQTLQKNLVSLGLNKIGISKNDFGGVNTEYFSKHLKGVPLWIAP